MPLGDNGVDIREGAKRGWRQAARYLLCVQQETQANVSCSRHGGTHVISDGSVTVELKRAPRFPFSAVL